MHILALTLDLDDTLWPVLPALQRADEAVDAWLRQHHPDVALKWPIDAMRALRLQVAAERADLAHDFTTQRQLTLRQAFDACGVTDAPVDALWEIYFAARNAVELYADSLPALQRIAARWPLASLTNGNADLQRVGLAAHFRGCITAREFGVGKPEPAIFHEACRRLGVPAAQVLHVGDDPLVDVAGALRAGLQAAWVRRDDAVPAAISALDTQPQFIVTDLAELADRLGA